MGKRSGNYRSCYRMFNHRSYVNVQPKHLGTAVYPSNQGPNDGFNASAFAAATEGRLGDSGTGNVEGPPLQSAAPDSDDIEAEFLSWSPKSFANSLLWSCFEIGWPLVLCVVRRDRVAARTDYSQIAFEVVDGIVVNCLPVWFPRLGVILYVAGLGLALTNRVWERCADAARLSV